MATKVQIRGDNAAVWVTVNPILAEREMGLEKDTKKFKFGDGTTAWNSLPYATFTPDYTEVAASLGAGTLLCNCANNVDMRFLSPLINANTTISFVNNTLTKLIQIVIPITGTSIVLTFPSDVRMARYNESPTGLWNFTTKALTVGSIAAGDLHEFSLMQTGSIYILRYDGPIRP